MPEHEPDDRELRAAFESFRSDALDSVAPPSADAVRAAARHRHRTHIAVGSAAAAVALVAMIGGGVLLTQHGQDRPPVTAAASSAGTRVTTGPSASPPTGDRSGGTPSPTPSDSGNQAGNPNGPDRVVLAMSADPVPLTPDSSGRYSGPVRLTVRNSGTEPIARATIRLTVPGDLGFRAEDVSCSGGACELRTLEDLAPGAERSVSGTLTYAGVSADSTEAPSAPPPGTVEVTVTDEGGTQVASASQQFTVDLQGGTGPTPGDGDQPSGSPSPSSPSPAPTDGG
ncbi:hypothetical protein [Actinocatenispora rupis]|uniref:DUF11 domain-containing protein n=1 Tax=Actinocatenispora rupis TaxID=519421 RepID=A0A8J3J6X3_9ACTN|nr:hypothetical protein [Actinocatenispora rupis]GID11292.1 hypothetical protein Aru02nite_21810 [Actinocatenispora rupis]